MSQIDYSPIGPDVYGYVPPYDPIYDGIPLNKAIVYLIEDFEFHTKNILSHKEACNYYKHNLAIQGIKCTQQDVEDAYTICYGHGAEYEWEVA